MNASNANLEKSHLHIIVSLTGTILNMLLTIALGAEKLVNSQLYNLIRKKIVRFAVTMILLL